MSTDLPAPADPADGSRRPLRETVLRERLLAPAGPVDDVRVVARTGSTSSDLAATVRDDAAARTGVRLLVTEHQVDGRGRSGRSWQTPPAAALTYSLSLRPTAAAERWGWLPLLVGLGVVRAVRSVTGVAATVKWPNDLLVDVPGEPAIEGWGTERKVGGILVELVPTASGPVAVVGVGLNVSQRADELPVPTATSLTGAGALGGAAGAAGAGAGPAGVDREELLVACVRAVTALVGRWDAAAGDAAAAGLADEVAAACATLGRDVRVELPAQARLDGVATGLAADGALLVRDADGQVRAVRAGDVRHLRSRAGGAAG
jgi:BirA family transcriptional regulator, biotin operon repressor / biotin---[acetyl-CoA-carboxylase] ligase